MSIQMSTNYAIQYAKQYRAEEIRTAERSRIAAQFRTQRRFTMFRRAARTSSRGVSSTVTATAEASAAV